MNRRGILLVAFALLLACLLWAAPQQGSDQGQQDQSSQKKKKKTGQQQQQQQQQQDQGPLGSGQQVGGKSSKQKVDSATLGFNGIGPDGSVDQAKLKTPPSSDDYEKAAEVKEYSVAPADLTKFIVDGNLGGGK